MNGIQNSDYKSILSMISITALAGTYRRNSFDGTVKYSPRKGHNISHSYKPAWNTWTEDSSCFFLKVTVSIFLNDIFQESKFLWFNVIETPDGIQAICCQNTRLRFKLSSKRFLNHQYEKLNTSDSLLPMNNLYRSDISLNFEKKLNQIESEKIFPLVPSCQ
jgi:hypothetical protein